MYEKIKSSSFYFRLKFLFFFFIKSHLRGQVLPRQTSNSPEDNYKTLYESIIESELPPEKNKPTQFVERNDLFSF